MFGIGFFEILIILVVAVIFLGPDKLPQAIVDFVKFFRAVKKTINEAKDTLDKELEIDKLKNEVSDIKSRFESQTDSITKDMDLANLQEIREIADEMRDLGATKEIKAQDEISDFDDLSKNLNTKESLFGEYSALPPQKSTKKNAKNPKTEKIAQSSSTKSTSKSTKSSATKSTSKSTKSNTKSTTKSNTIKSSPKSKQGGK